MRLLTRCLLLAAWCIGTDAGALTVRILTFNIHHAEGDDGKVDLDRIVRVVRSAHADVVCLQEIDRNLPRTQHQDFPALLAEKLGMKVCFEANYRFDGGEYGNATLSNLPLLSSRNHALPNPPKLEPRGCLEVVLRVGSASLHVFNTHLGLRREERTEQVKAILSLLPESNAVLAGDFNEVPEGPPLALLLGPLRDSFNVAEKGQDKTYSTTVLDRRIDYVLHTPDLMPKSARILNDPESAAASDHLPYVVEIEVP